MCCEELRCSQLEALWGVYTPLTIALVCSYFRVGPQDLGLA